MVQVPRVSVVIPVLNEAGCLPRLHQELRSVCDPLPYQFEFVFVDDGSTDPTAQVLSRLRSGDERVRYLRLSRNFGHQAALTAGLAYASGHAVIMMDGDLQHPPRLIPTLLDRWRDGHDVVGTLRLETEDIPASKRFFSALFYRVFNSLSTVRIEPGNADFRLLSRAAVDALGSLPERHRFLRGLILWLGFPRTQVEFKAPARYAGRSKYTFHKNIRFALEGLTAFNFYPLRVVAAGGGLIAATSLVASLACFAAYARTGQTGPALAAATLFATFLCAGQLVVLGILGEYIGRVLEQVKGRPTYIVRDSEGFTIVDPPSRAIPAPHVIRPGPRGTARGADGPSERQASEA
jgi:dolichol-phosphate mannosyltransferase